ncbi:MAG TPA: glutamine-synthetase adenylyltransferase, partial [Acetobacteraceae bacterium]|nr:glutamine-synthetase adenylyltransferase [Acetobacteraceae bacterium]
QLIWGGRDPALRDPTTLGALAALVAADKLDRRAAADLADAYVFLRKIEHRLQMVADRQTHRLPEDADGLARIAAFAGYGSAEAFASAFLDNLARVERHYARLFEAAPSLGGSDEGGSLVFTGVEDDPDTLATLARMGYANPSSVAAMVRGWHHGHARAMRSERARELMTALMPTLLAAFGRQAQPDQALARFDALLARLSAGVQLLSLLHRNPALLDRLAGLLGAAPQLADHVARHPGSLEGLLTGTAEGTGAASTLPALLKEARHMEEALEAARRLVTQGRFEVDAATFEGTLDMDESGLRRSALADAAIGALLPHVAAEFADRHGTVPGGALAVVALGKLGGREMLPASDLDLILVYDHDPAAEMSAGRARRGAPPIRPLPASQYFIRLAHQVIAAITAPGGEGKLYEVDMRLRPSGSKGPVAVSLASFRRYHAESAWTWERMALTRARLVCGPPAHARRLAQAIRAALTRPAEAATVLSDAVAMRARLLRELPGDGPWDAKLRPGGLVEVEFIAQALQLVHAHRHPEVLATTTREALDALRRVGALSADEAAHLVAADRLWRTVTGMLRLTVGRWREEQLPGPAAGALLRAVARILPDPPSDAGALRTRMDLVAAETRRIFERRLGPVEGAVVSGGL